MITYAKKYNSKHKFKTRVWRNITVYPDKKYISSMDWHLFDFRINDVVYTSPSTAFKDAYAKEVVWERLQQ